MWLTLALPAHVLVKALSPAFFAREDTMTPLVAALKGVVLAIAAAFLLSHWYGADGIARGDCAWRVEHGVQPDPPRRGDVWVFDRCGAQSGGCRASRYAALAMGALLWLATRLLPALGSGAHGLVQAVLLLAVIAAGIAIYGLFLRLFGVTGWREAVNAVRQTSA